jgi:glycyl-tRNA synthetase alpha chain
MATCSSKNEQQMSKYNFEVADTDSCSTASAAEAECMRCIDANRAARRL